MTQILEYMTNKHRHCDDVFSAAESAVARNDWSLATTKWHAFVEELELHLYAEENVLFPEFEQATGMTSGPTQVMRMEHEQMRGLVSSINETLKRQDMEGFLGFSETLMVLMQQHNMKEEMMLYPMCQQHIDDSLRIVDRLKQHCEK